MKTKKPNVIWICTDQQRSDSLGCTGNKWVRTPHIDSIAKAGTRFTHHYTPMQICSPSRATMFTGQFPRNHGLTTNGRALDPDIATLTTLLSKSGYRTHSVGKQHLEPILAPKELNMPDSRAFWKTGQSETWTGPYYGFQTLDLLLGESDTAAIAGHYANWLKEYHPDSAKLLEVAASSMTPPSDLDEIWRSAIPPELHYNSWITDNAVDFIANNSKEENDPFFLFVSYPDPHHPFDPPGDYADRYVPEDMPLPRVDPDELARMPEYYGELFPKGKGFRELYWAATDDEAGSMITTENISDRTMQQAIAHTYGMIEMIDDGVGKILEVIQNKNISENTLILFTSDHGELLGTHGLLHKGPPPYKQLTEICMIMKGPGIAQDQRIYSLTSHIDLKPTFMELLDIYADQLDPDNSDGISLAPLLAGNMASVRTHLFGEYHPTIRDNVYNQTIRTADWRLTIYPNHDQWGELFNLELDPEEHINLFNDTRHQEIRNELAQLLSTEFPPAMNAGSEMICKW